MVSDNSTCPVVVGKCNFTINASSSKYMSHIHTLTERLRTYKKVLNGNGSVINVLDKDYFGYDKKNNVYRFPIGIFDTVRRAIADIDIKNAPGFKPKKIDINYTGPYTPTDYQREAIDKIVDVDGNVMNTVNIDPGGGKTLIACMAMKEMSVRTFIIVRKTDVHKWRNDLTKNLGENCGSIYSAVSGDKLEKLVNMKRDNIPDFIVVSISTLQRYIDKYEKGLLPNNIPPPDKLMSHLGIGFVVNDETHLFFHDIYIMMCYFNVDKFLSLSGTLDASDDRKRGAILSMLPDKYRINTSFKAKKYLDVYAVQYYLSNQRGIKTGYAFGYNHIRFEQSVLGKRSILVKYLELISDLLQKYFLYDCDTGDKCLIFMSSVEMCVALRDYLISKVPDKRVCKLVSGDDYDESVSSDIIVSTTKSVGTGKDIPMLTTVIQTDSVTEKNTNVQAPLRIRYIPNKKLRYVYTYSLDIPSQVRKHFDRKRVIEPRANSFRTINSGVSLS